ncbi:segregation/condensation protein A [Candidatus Kaiserbacteria bacterium]|nr:segregation/condensation protein A [Candidatus Kaiserbacteria bacterium]
MTGRFALSTEVFQGPLETLLNMIEDRKMSISDVSLAEVTDAYLSYVEKLPELPLGETAQFILVASTLLLIKSRALLPSLELSSDERESVQELERRLARYAVIRKSAKLLRKTWGSNPLLLAYRAPLREPIFRPGNAALGTVAGAAMRLVSILPKPEALAQAAVAPILALEDVIKSVRTRLVSAIRTTFREMTKSRDRHEVIVYFLAMLELVRSGSASVTQERLFEDITIELENTTAPRYGT